MKQTGLVLFFTAFFLSVTVLAATSSRCQTGCQRSSSSTRAGQQRTTNKKENLGNDTSLTRPYPFKTPGSKATEMKYRLLVDTRCDLNITEYQPFANTEQILATEAIINLMSIFVLCKVNAIKDSFQFVSLKKQPFRNLYEYSFIIEVVIALKPNGYNHITFCDFFEDKVKPALKTAIEFGEFNRIVSSIIESREIIQNYPNVTRKMRMLGKKSDEIIEEDCESNLIVQTKEHFHTSKFCEVGCSIFFSLPSDPVELVECIEICNNMYEYNITVGYNYLAEAARLECHNGCHMALRYCQPGYYCSQAKVLSYAAGNSQGYGEFMAHCPAGTYRDVSSNVVEECVACPPGTWRESIKGVDVQSCGKCPVGTYSNHSGSSSIKNCLRCPAGTFTTERGSKTCICITPGACSKEQLRSPADAEKRETVPYIGRW